MAISEDVAFLDATAEAELVRKKVVKPIELVDAAIERIERLNPELNAACIFKEFQTARFGLLCNQVLVAWRTRSRLARSAHQGMDVCASP